MALRTRDERRIVRQRRMNRLWFRLAGRIAISACLLWHFYAVIMWNMPANVDLTNPALQNTSQDDFSLVRKYMTSTGFMQGWGMFAPDPYSFDVYVSTRVHYADGSDKDWTFPRMHTEGYWLRYQQERWRKYIEIAHQDQYKFLWPSMAHYAAQVNNTQPGNPPVSVDLIRHWRFVRPPSVKPEDWSQYQFETVEIKPEDLR